MFRPIPGLFSCVVTCKLTTTGVPQRETIADECLTTPKEPNMGTVAEEHLTNAQQQLTTDNIRDRQSLKNIDME